LKTDHFKTIDISVPLTQISVMWISIEKYHNKDGTEVTKLQAGCQGNFSLIPGREGNFFSFQCPDQLWGSLNFYQRYTSSSPLPCTHACTHTHL